MILFLQRYDFVFKMQAGVCINTRCGAKKHIFLVYAPAAWRRVDEEFWDARGPPLLFSHYLCRCQTTRRPAGPNSNTDMTMDYIISRLDWQQTVSAFIVLFAVIDVFGSTPIIIDLKQKGRPVSAFKATFIASALLVGFFFAGDAMLRLFNVDIESFAVAGALVIFLMALEMILDIEIFKNTGPIKEATLVPVVFPLLAGAGSFTTLLSLRAEYASPNILLALALNMLLVYGVLRATERVERILSRGAIYLMRKFFGIILLAISVRLFTANLSALLGHM